MTQRKPIEQKKALGNLGRRPLPEPVDVQPPMAPSVLAQTPLDLLSGVLVQAEAWLGATDAVAVSLLHVLLMERVEVTALMAAGDDSVQRHDLRKIDADIIKLLSRLGLDPVARSGLGLSEVRAMSSLEQMRAAKAAG